MKWNMDQNRLYYLRRIYVNHHLTAQVSFDEHSRFESLERNRVSNVSFVVCSAGEVIILGIMIGILKAVKSDESVKNNTMAFSVLLAFTGGVWCSFARSFTLVLVHLIKVSQCYVLFLGSYLKSADQVSIYLQEPRSLLLDSSRRSSLLGSVFG